MSIKKFFATADTTIADAYQFNNSTRSQYANLGGASSLELYSASGSISSTSLEKSRILMKFPINEISASRASGSLPASGSVNFFMRVFNVEHPLTLPKQYYLMVSPITQDWEEGYGLDLEGYTDIGLTGSSGSSGIGCNWILARSGSAWNNQGGDFLTSSYVYSYYIDKGTEDIMLDVTGMVEAQISGALDNYGVMIKLSGSYEDGSQSKSFYTKRFSARTTNFFYSKPHIEARWDSSVFDDRNNFYASSSLLSGEDNKQTLCFYNRVAGTYKNIPGNPTLTVKLYSDESRSQQVSASFLTVINPNAGIYKASVALDTTASTVYDSWVNAAATGTVYFSSSFDVNSFSGIDYNFEPKFVFSLTNLKSSYQSTENARIRVFSREIDWKPTIYTVSQNSVENKLHKNLYYRILRVVDNLEVIPYGTGSIPFTRTSYDKNGNYFDVDMSILEKGYSYSIKFMLLEDSQVKELKESFKFRVE